MALLKHKYATLEEVPEQFRELYTKVKDAYECTAIEGMKTIEDVKRVQDSLNAERAEHKATKEKYVAPWGDRDPSVEIPRLELIPELEAKAAAAGTKFDENNPQLQALLQVRLDKEKNPVVRERDKLKTDLEAARAQIAQYDRQEKIRKIHDVVREVAAKTQIDKTSYATPESMLMILAERHLEVTEEGHVVTKDVGGLTPGLLPDIWLQEIEAKHPFLRPNSQGGGANGSGSNGKFTGKNPFTNEHWNVTLQGQLLRESPEKAKAMMEHAGAPGLGIRPPKK